MEDKLYMILGQLQAEVSNIKQAVARTDKRLVDSTAELRLLIDSRLTSLHDTADDHEARLIKAENNWKWVVGISSVLGSLFTLIVSKISHILS